MNNDKDHRESITGLGLGFNAGRPAPDRKPTPEPPKTECVDLTRNDQSVTYRDMKVKKSDENRLLPAFARVSDDVGRELTAAERDRARRTAALTDPEKLEAHKRALAAAVRDGDMTEAEAASTWDRAHPDTDPATLQKRKSR